MQTFTLEATAKTRRLALALVAALALVFSLLTPVAPAKATGTAAITGINPTSGPATTSVTITGTNLAGLTGADAVRFGTNNASSYTVNSATSVTAVVPTGTGTVNISVKRPDGSITTLNNGFTYKTVILPTISSVSPTSGTAVGYNTITINGSNFTGTSSVRFNTTAAVAYTINSDSRITAVVPEGTAGSTVRVYVQNAAGTTTSVANYTYKTATCLAGNYRTVKFGYKSSTLNAKQKRQIRNTADEFVSLGCERVELLRFIGKRAGASTTFRSYLTLQNKRANAVNNVLEKRLATWSIPVFVTEVKRANQLNLRKRIDPDAVVKYRNIVLRVPSSQGIETVYPNSGTTTGGGTIVITGSGFTNLAATGAVRFGLTASPSYTVNATGTKITATVPAGVAGSTNVTVQTGVAGTRTAELYSKSYSYLSAPTITSLNATSGSITGGTSVTITGTNFSAVTAVRFGTANAVSFTVNSSTSITAVSPAAAVGPQTIQVVAGGGTVSNLSFNYVSSPAITGLAWAAANSGTLTISGTGLATAGVTVAGTSVTPHSNSATSIELRSVTQPVTTPGVSIVITTPIGSATKSAIKPAITSASWTSAAGGTLTIVGTGLAGATKVSVGATEYDSNITAQAGQVVVTGVTAPTTAQNLVVVTPIGESAPSSFLFPAGTPSAPTAVAGDTQATVTVAAPASGGTPTGYTITATPGGATCTITGSSGSCNVTGLTNGTPYTFTAVATNATGSSAASAASNEVIPSE
jgi:large repetitive protein